MLRWADVIERVIVAALCVPFLLAFARALPMHPQLILIAASETLAVILILIRKPGPMVLTPYAFAIAIVGTALPLLVTPGGGTALVPVWLSTSAMFAGLSVNVLSKLFLNRSFGAVAANRGVKRGGPYALIRHPMYLGYCLNQLGFLLASFTLTTLAIYALLWTTQLLRIREEERMLSLDKAYRDYSERVRYRLIPGLV